MCVRCWKKKKHISQLINFQRCRRRLAHILALQGCYILYIYGTIISHDIQYHLRWSCFYFSHSLSSLKPYWTHNAHTHTHTHTHTHCTVERQHFPLTSVSPKCDIQPRSAVISRGPGEGEPVEKFKQHAHQHAQIQHMHTRFHTQTTAERIMGWALNQGCHRSRQVTVKEHILRLTLLICRQRTHW